MRETIVLPTGETGTYDEEQDRWIAMDGSVYDMKLSRKFFAEEKVAEGFKQMERLRQAYELFLDMTVGEQKAAHAWLRERLAL